MELEQITTIINSVLSTLALIIATVAKTKKTKSLEDIELKAEIKKQKYIAKQAKKNGVAVDLKSVDDKVDTQTTTGYTSLGN